MHYILQWQKLHGPSKILKYLLQTGSPFASSMKITRQTDTQLQLTQRNWQQTLFVFQFQPFSNTRQCKTQIPMPNSVSCCKAKPNLYMILQKKGTLQATLLLRVLTHMMHKSTSSIEHISFVWYKSVLNENLYKTSLSQESHDATLPTMYTYENAIYLMHQKSSMPTNWAFKHHQKQICKNQHSQLLALPESTIN